MKTIWHDIRFGFRQLCKSPCFTLIAVLSLALGIGANTAIFSLINGMLLKSLPVRDSHELRCLYWTNDTNLYNVTVSGSTESLPSGQVLSNAFSQAAYEAFSHKNNGLSDVLALSLVPNLTVIAKGTARMADGLTVSGNFFQGLRTNPLLGRTIAPKDDKAGAEPVAVFSYYGWQKHFGGNPEILGQTVILNGNSYVVVGVLDQGFEGVLAHSRTEVYVPLTDHGRLRPDFSLASPGNWGIQVIARLDPSADERQVRAGLDVLFRRSIRPNQVSPESRPPQILLRDGRRGFADARSRHTRSIFILMTIVSIVLLVACINLAGLLLARGARREHELSVRTALGAQQHHLLRQSLAESVLLVLVGASCGSFLGTWGKTFLARLLLPANMPIDVGTDLRVFAFTLSISILAVILFGLIPAFRATRTNPMLSLKNRSSLGTPHLRLGRVLVSIQVGLCLLLLIGAGLFVRTLINLRKIDVGFETQNLLTFQVNAHGEGYEGTRLVDFYDQLEKNIEELPGVQAVAMTNIELFAGWRNETMMVVPNRSGRHHILKLDVSDSFLPTIGIPLLAGRGFNKADNATSAKVIVVNRMLAENVFPGENPLGRSVIIHRQNYRIVGICGDTKYYDIKVPTQPMVFFSLRQHPNSLVTSYYQVRTTPEPLSLVPAVRQALGDLDPKIPIAEIKTQTIQLNESIAKERLFASLGTSLALLAILLACIGLYGLLTYNVTRRVREMGIRMALGATPRNIVWPILRTALTTVGAGIVLGLPVALAIVRIVRSVLFGVEFYDPAIMIGAAFLLLVVAVLAAWIPAHRAARIDPMVALRYE